MSIQCGGVDVQNPNTSYKNDGYKLNIVQRINKIVIRIFTDTMDH